MSWLRRCTVPLGLLLAATLLCGCGPKELSKKETVPTRGKVTRKGQPVQFAIIRLKPTEPGEGAPADGLTGKDGTFELRTYSNGDPDGAVPGHYEVELEGYDAAKAGALPKGAKPTAITANMQKPGVTVEVKDEEIDLAIDIP